MSRLAPTWALSAQAIDAAADPHLRPGVHLRVLPAPALGLPLAPLLVQRIALGHPERVGRPVDVVWSDAAGRPLTPPFELGDTGTATAWLPSTPGDPVLWAEVLIEDARPLEVFRAARRQTRELLELETMATELLHAERFGKLERRRLPRSGVRVDALVSGLLGPAVVATAIAAPYQVSATGMDRVEVSGFGSVVGIRVLRASSVEKGEWDPWRLLALPVESGRRYHGLEDAWGEAENRVLRGAPQLLGLHDQPDASDPASCNPASDGEELDRVTTLWAERLERMVDVLLNDLTASPGRLRMQPEPLSGTRSSTATLQVPPLASVLQAALDPGVGRLLGFVEHDDAPPGNPGDLVVYAVRGAWTLYPRHLRELLTLLTLGGDADPNGFPLPLPPIVHEAPEGPFADFWTAAAVVVGAATPPPARPAIGAPEDLGWLPEVPPSARRHVVLPLSGLVPAAALAVARETPGTVGLNSRLPDVFGGGAPDRAIPIVPGVLAELGPTPAAQAPGQGEVHDRGAGAKPTEYRVAQADWFGRWSPWTFATAPAGIRPAVPVPVLEATFVPPATPGDSGNLEVRCLQPRDPDLAPGSFPLQTLEVRAQVGGGSEIVGSAAARRGPAPTGADDTPLVVTVPVPPLAPAEKRWLQARGRWKDSDGRWSQASLPTRAQAADPRAPVPLVLPNTLEYAARPDALGRSRVRLSWTAASAPTGYRVYHADETTLRQRLAGLGGSEAAAARDELAAARTAPDRAAVFRNHAGLFDRSCFELLTATPLVSPGGGELSYEHGVSGSLAVLVFYRVVPVSELGAEADFLSCTLLPRGVPNSPPPPTPTLTVTADPADPTRVRLTVSVPAGQTAPVAVRLRRSRVSGGDPLGMPVVATETPGAWPAKLVDAGGTPWDVGLPFAAWSTYTWRAEVQGAPEPGSSLPGAWSAPSAPASLRIIPPPPGAVTPGSASDGPAGVEVRFTSTASLDAGPEGTYVVDVYRRTPTGSSLASGAVGSFPAGTIRQVDGSYLVRDSAPVPPGTVYLVEVADPLGRRGPRVEVATLA